MQRFKIKWSKRGPIEEKYLKASREHSVIYDHIQKFDVLINGKTGPDTVRQLKELTITFAEDLDQHFVTEEQVLFPAALYCLQSLDIYDLVLVLQKEHGYLERDFAEISDRIQFLSSRQKKIPEDLKTCMNRFLQALKQHAGVEIEDLFKKMDDARVCTKLIKGITIPT